MALKNNDQMDLLVLNFGPSDMKSMQLEIPKI